MSRALKAAADEAADRMHHLMSFARGAMENLDKGLPPPSAADAKAYRELTISSLRKLTKFPLAVVPLSSLIDMHDARPRSLAELARTAIVGLSLGLINPGQLIYLVCALREVREVEPPGRTPPARRTKGLVRLPDATVLRALPQRTGPSTRDLFGDLE